MQSKNNIETKDDQIYYNISIVNNDLVSKVVNFQQQLTGNIIDDPNDYYLSCIRFYLNGTSMPLFLFPNPSPYYVSLTYKTFSAQAALAYVPQPTSIYPQPVYEYQYFADLVNTALKQCFTNLGLASGGTLPVGSVAPYILYNPKTTKFEVYAQIANYDESITYPISLYMNESLFALFNNFWVQYYGQNLPTRQDYRIRILNLYGQNSAPLDPSVPTGYYRMDQEWINLTPFWEPVSIVFKTNRMGVRSEYIQGANLTTNLNSAVNPGTGIPYDNVMTDFIPAFGYGDAAGWRTDLTYYPTSQYRLIDLLGSQSNYIDLSIFWKNQQGVEYPYVISPNTSVSVKLAFVKKSLYKNYKKN